MEPMRVLALDMGEARIGLAVGETGSPWAFGLGYLVRQGLEADLKALAALAEQERAERFVVGLPLRTDGSLSAQAEGGLALVEARPVDAILAEAKNPDLIVMGTHGRSGLDRFMLGSVTEAVLHRSDKPVLVLRSK